LSWLIFILGCQNHHNVMKRILPFLFAMLSLTVNSQTADTVNIVEIDPSAFQKVDVEASFPGGLDGWRKYLEQNLNPNVPVENDAPIGIYTVVVQFIVDKTGAISDIKALTNFGYGMEQEVLRIMKKSPVWTPAMQNNRPVKAYRKQPITFVLDHETIEIIMHEKYILYTGMDNIIMVKVDKLKNEDLEVSMSQGTVELSDDGTFHIRVNNPGKAILFINSKKRNKEIGSVYFTVKKKK